MYSIGLSRLGINVRDFYELTPKEFIVALVDFQEREKLSAEVLIRTMEYNTWESTRVLLLHLYNMNPYIKRKIKRSHDLFELPWDNRIKKEVNQQSIEEMKQMLIAIHNRSKGNKK